MLLHSKSARALRNRLVNILTIRQQPASTNRPILEVSDEIQNAVQTHKPVVALESTIYTHGFPYPENVKLATDLESLVRKYGALPATIGVLNGVARVGFTSAELEELASSAGKPHTKKLSRRDLGYICGLGITGRNLNGGTTIAGTMILAHLAGIKIFATGGLGGVHKGGENSMDISADLTELGRTPVAVISSGCKSFLDIRRTLEFLETQGVGVGTFADGRQGVVDFPAFWTRESGIPSPLNITNEKEAAAIIYAQSVLGISSGLLFANPISERHSIPKETMDSIMAQAIEEAERMGISGSDNTPFILKKIRELTHGATITANRSLVEDNVIRGTKVAIELATLELQSLGASDRAPFLEASASSMQGKITRIPLSIPAFNDEAHPSELAKVPSSRTTEVLVAGSLAIDLSCDFVPDGKRNRSISPQLHTSNLATITHSLGGVGQNIASALHYLGISVHLCSIVGNDIAGVAALKMISERGLSTAGIMRSKNGSGTAQYVAVNDAQKNLVLAMADMEILETNFGFDQFWESELHKSQPKWLVVDANWDESTLNNWIVGGKSSGAIVAYEPVSVVKSKRLFAKKEKTRNVLPVFPNHSIHLATPNRLELTSMYAAAREAGLFERQDWWRTIDAMGMPSSGSRNRLVAITNANLVDEGIPQQTLQLLPFIPSIVTKLGAQGVLLTQLLSSDDSRLTCPASAPYILSRSADDETGIVGGVYMRFFGPVERVPDHEILSVNGVGDTFLAVLVAGLAAREKGGIGLGELVDLVHVAQRGSVMTLKSKEAVSPEICTLWGSSLMGGRGRG